MISGELILFYDGDCGFCNRMVQLVIDHERKPDFKFAPLSHPMVKQFSNAIREKDSLIVWDGKQCLVQFEAALFVASRLRFPFRMVAMFSWIPKTFGDKCYAFIAKRRKGITKGKVCTFDVGNQHRFL